MTTTDEKRKRDETAKNTLRRKPSTYVLVWGLGFGVGIVFMLIAGFVNTLMRNNMSDISIQTTEIILTNHAIATLIEQTNAAGTQAHIMTTQTSFAVTEQYSELRFEQTHIAATQSSLIATQMAVAATQTASAP